MRFKISFLSILFLAAISMVALNTTVTYAQEKEKTVTDKATKSRGGGEDENIKMAKPHNNPDLYGKEREKTRTATTKVIVKNKTGWYIDVYNDGNYQGTVSPYGDAYFYDYGDIIQLYAKAVFDDGSYYYWGPKSISNDQYYSYTWSLSY